MTDPQPADPQPAGPQPAGPQPAGPTHDDLDAVWEHQPDEDYRRDMSHWRGQGRWDDEAWAAIGRSSRATIASAAALLGRSVPSGPLLEWGPGGGTNLVAFADSVERLYGVDVSARNLHESARVLAEIDGSAPFTAIELGDDLDAVRTAATDPIEVFISTAVFQHFPSRDYGAQVLRVVASLLAPSAIGLVQIRYDDGTPKYAQRTGDYRRQHVTYTSYPIDDFWDLLVGAGLRPIAVTAIDSAINYATFTFVPA